MKIMGYVVCVLLSVFFTFLFLCPRIGENKVAWETQLQFNEKVIECLDAQIQTNEAVFNYLKTISKKPGH